MTDRHSGSDRQMHQLRELVLGKDNAQVTRAVKDNAREIVGEVFSEALHDRQKQDGSVNRVLQPLVEKSVERSVSSHREQFVGYLYPLVGSLVRKSVTAFLAEFLEKTNELIENSLTVKGLKWRFKAWQAGVSFSQYVANQTFVYRVEQVLLIHKETGILLNSLSYNRHSSADADLISSMLTAINDFVADSFTNDSTGEQQLDEIKTGDFTLYIRPGPQAIVVAAVTGRMPANGREQLQISLEEIHRLYSEELTAFSGDTVPFESTESLLRECLMAELKPEVAERKRRPWMAWLIVLLVVGGFGYILLVWWQVSGLSKQLRGIDQEPGIVVKEIGTVGISQAFLSVLRDPAAQPVQQWLAAQAIDADKVVVQQAAYLSLDQEIVLARLNDNLTDYPGISVDQQQDNTVSLRGLLSGVDYSAMLNSIQRIPGIKQLNLDLSGLEVQAITDMSQTRAAKQAVFDKLIGDISSTHIQFDILSSEIQGISTASLQRVVTDFSTLLDLSQQLGLNIGLLVIGASDPQGSIALNQQLSYARANAVREVLVASGIDSSKIIALGIGELPIGEAAPNARAVLFNIMQSNTQTSG